ncbi:MAG: hypothetical protein KAS01_00185 [Candidatus Pacebacteria bacterium]|nr:hypothetical protein [Candidatus Paceibacterota bacterium]
MKEKYGKIILFFLVVFMATSFTGCLGLTGEKEAVVEDIVDEKNYNQGVFKSIDGGKTWEHKVNLADTEGELIDKVKISSMEMDPENNQILYLGTQANGLYKSIDSADSWKKVIDENKILSVQASIYKIVIEKGNSDMVYLATLNSGSGEFLKSEDGGVSWSRKHIMSKSGEYVSTITIDPIHKNVVYLGTSQGGLLKSEDRGESWFSMNWFSASVEDILVDFQNNAGIIVRTKTEMQKSIDGGRSWELLNKKIKTSLKIKINHSLISSAKMSDIDSLMIYLTYNHLIFITKDGGDVWEKLNTITPQLTVIKQAPKVKRMGMKKEILYYGAGNAIYKSLNRGETWSSYAIPIIGDVRYTLSDYTNSDIIYVGSFYDPPKKKR